MITVSEPAFFSFSEHTSLIATSVSVYGYMIRPVILVLFIRLTRPGDRRWPLWTLCGINAAVYALSFFTPYVIYFSDDARFHRGPLGYCCAVVSFLLLIYLIILAVRSFSELHRNYMAILLFSSFVILASSVIDMRLGISLPISFLMTAIVSGSIFYYLWLHLRTVREHESSMLAESRIQIMMSQIQPHFLYNTLAAIQALCATDPRTAARTVEQFGNYLRQNLESLSETNLVPLNKELEHTRIYTDIELLMFPEIQIDYRIEDRNFLLPALTIQPIVENAIRHGVRGVADPHVSVTTRRDSECHFIEIIDNGKGYDPAQVSKSGDTHIGIRNVRERLEKMCGGDLEVESSPGTGCRVTIRIPVRKDDRS